MPGLLAGFINYKNPTGAEPVPKSALMNDTTDFTMAVEPGKTYFFRLTNIGAFAGQYFWIEGHTMKIIEVDGVYTEPAEADMIYLTAAQRYSFLVTAKDDSSSNFAMVSSMDEVRRYSTEDRGLLLITKTRICLTLSHRNSTLMSPAGSCTMPQLRSQQLNSLTRFVPSMTSVSNRRTVSSSSIMLITPSILI